MEKETYFLKRKLSHIQLEMKVPKNLYNSFGKYNYRNAETILETAKPVCHKYKTTLVVEDEIINVGDRYYIKATARLIDWESAAIIEVSALAREEAEKKGMDASQVTGSCSSYARKYALNGLFCLDDVKDADSDEQGKELENKQKATPKQIEMLENYYTDENLEKLLKANKIEKLEDISKDKAAELIGKIMNRRNNNG